MPKNCYNNFLRPSPGDFPSITLTHQLERQEMNPVVITLCGQFNDIEWKFLMSIYRLHIFLCAIDN